MTDQNRINESLNKISTMFLIKNYDYAWISAMLYKAGLSRGNSTLITGSSHGLNAIWEPAWENAVNCSMHSQDIYYDYACAKHVINDGGIFKRCIIVMGYYIAYQDVSLSTSTRGHIVGDVYFPLLGDSHNWKELEEGTDPWRILPDAGDVIRKKCEEIVRNNILEEGTYYSRFVERGTYFDFKGKKWGELTPGERDAFGRERALSHNKSYKYKETYQNNLIIMKRFIKLLYENDIEPVVVITPFTKEYNRYVNENMKQGVFDMLNSVEYDINFVDFNDVGDAFELDDFMDTDHLSLKGAKKVSGMLVDLFGR